MSRLLDVSELLGSSPVRYERKPGDPESAAKQAESYASDERKRLLEGAAPSGLRAQVPQPTPATLTPPKQQAPINLAPLKRPAAAKSPSLDISKNLPPAGSVGRDNGADDDNFAEYDPKSSSDFMDGIGKAFDTYSRMTGGVAKGVADATVDSLPSWLRNANIPNLGAADNPYATDPLPPSVDKVGDALRGGAHFAADMATDPLTYVGGPAAKGSVAAIGGAIKGIGALAAKTGITKGMMAVLPSMFTRYVQRARMMPGGLPGELDAYLKKLQSFGNDTAKADAWANKTFSPQQQEVLMKQAEEFFGGLHGELKAAQGAKAAKPAPAPEVVKPFDEPATAYRNKPKGDGFVIDPDVVPEPPPQRVPPVSSSKPRYEAAATEEPYAGRFTPVYGRQSGTAAPSGGAPGGKAPAEEAATSGFGGNSKISEFGSNVPFLWRAKPNHVQAGIEQLPTFQGQVSAQRHNKWMDALNRGEVVMPNGKAATSLDDVRSFLTAPKNMGGAGIDRTAAEGVLSAGMENGMPLDTLLKQYTEGNINPLMRKRPFPFPTNAELATIGAGASALGTGMAVVAPSVLGGIAGAGARLVGSAAQNARGEADERVPGVGGIPAGGIDDAISRLERSLQQIKGTDGWDRNPDNVDDAKRIEAAIQSAKAHKAGKR
jgi:hypothetical protein